MKRSILWGMTSTTTIKVPKELRDRLAAVARQDHLTLATVIARALDQAEERAFWSAVNSENSSLTDSERAQYRSASAGRDNLEDQTDDELGRRGGW